MEIKSVIYINAGRRKRNESDEDIEQVLAELALEYSGEKLVKDNKVENKSESNEQKIDDEDKKKKGKKDKKEKTEKNDVKDETADNNVAPDETVAPESNNTDMDVETSTVKTAAQKKKEKKEREKQKKLAQKKAVGKVYN